MEVVGVIPARFGSTRFPGKPLAKINGKPMIQHVYERAQCSKKLNKLLVATDNELIKDMVESFGGDVIMTSIHHESGSSRLVEVAEKVNGDLFVNIQGDEPLINPKLIDNIVKMGKNSPESVVTAKMKITDNNTIQDPNVVKVITDQSDNAIYFSRFPIPFNRSNANINYYKHIGIYCYPKFLLKQYMNLNESVLEKAEKLEQLRFLDNGYSIKVIETTFNSIGVDVIGDIHKIEMMMK